MPETLESGLRNVYIICMPQKTVELREEKTMTELENYVIFLLQVKLCEKDVNLVALDLLSLPWKDLQDFIEI